MGGGVLFIDEAYTLFGGSIFAKEAVDQLVQLMTEPNHIHKTVVILAGYKTQMEEVLRSANPGLCSRITGRIEFPNWEAEDSLKFIKTEGNREGIILDHDAENFLLAGLKRIRNRPGWANARDSKNLVSQLYSARALRLVDCIESDDASYTLGDVNKVIIDLEKQRPKGDASSLDSEMMMIEQNIQSLEQKFISVENENIRECEQERMDLHSQKANDDDQVVFFALLRACQVAGYDT